MTSRLGEWLAGPSSTKWMGYATLVLLLGTFLMVAAFGPTILTNSETSRRTDDLAACRAEYRAGIDTANIRLATATAAVQTGIARGLTASVQNDEPALAEALTDTQAATVDVNAAIDNLTVKALDYSEGVVLSREDPDGFLESCR